MKKILIMVPSLSLGGQERTAVRTAEILKMEYNVTILLFDGREQAFTTTVPICDIFSPPANGKIRKTIRVFERVLKVSRLIHKEKYDVIFSFGPSANLVNLLSIGRTKRIVSLRGYTQCRLSKAKELLHRRADSILCVSEGMARVLRTCCPGVKNKVHALFNPYDIGNILNKGNEQITDYSFNGKTLICHARLDEVKNFPRLIKALSIVRETEKDTRLLLIGEGEERQRLEDLVKQYSLSDAVTLIGFRSNPFAYLSKATLFVLSSYSEGFPNSLIEGMTFLPVVAVDCKTGPCEILRREYTDRQTVGWEKADYGYLVQPASDRLFHEEITEDDRILAEAILQALNDNEFMAKNRIDRVKCFDYAAYKARLENYIN